MTENNTVVVNEKQLINDIADHFFGDYIEGRKILFNIIEKDSKLFVTCRHCKYHEETPDGWHLCQLHYKVQSADNFCSEAIADEETTNKKLTIDDVLEGE